MSTRKIEDLLSEGHSRFTPLQRLLTRSANQKLWTQELRSLLEPPLKYEVEVTEIRGSVLHVVCRSAAAATRLRFMAPQIAQSLNALAAFQNVRELSIRVASG